MRVFIEDIVDAMDWSSAESFLNVDTGAILTFDDEYESAFRRCEELPLSATDEDVYDVLGYEDPELANFVKRGESFRRLPDSFEIHEYRIMEDFIAAVDDD